jgi:MarR family transcriptional regulator, organic hydroperoxide resistance regulator
MSEGMETLHDPAACSKVPPILREGLGWPVARAAHAITNAHNEALAPFSLSLRTFAVLAMIGAGAARSQLEIAQSVGLDKTTLVATIDDLEHRTLVVRAPDPSDRRARNVAITPQGRALLEQAAGAVRATEERIAAAMPAGEAERVKSSLIALIGGPLSDYLSRAGSCF